MGPFERIRRPQLGQASVELVAALPFVLLIGLVVWQCALAGHTAWMAAHAARSGARADVVGDDVETAVRSTLPDGLEHGLEVKRDGGTVKVRVRVPVLLHRWRSPISVGAVSSLGDGA